MHRLTPSQLVFIAGQHFDAGRLREAEDLCRQVLNGDSKMSAALHLAARTAARREKLDAAISLYKRAIEANPTNAAWMAELANIQRRAGSLDAAIASFNNARDLNPREPVLCPGLAEALQARGLLDEAIIAWQETVARLPHIADYHQNLGDVLQRAERFAEAGNAYRRALELNANSSAAWDRLGTCCHGSADIEGAIAAFQQAITLDPTSIDFQTHLGNALLENGDIDPAATAYCRAIELEPIVSDVYPIVGASKEPNRLEAAMIRAWELCAERAGDADSYFKLGVTVQLRSHIDEAISAYRMALKLSPNHLESRHNLGSALRDAGSYEEAMACFQAVLRADSRFMMCHSNIVYLMHFAPRHDPVALLKAHRNWNQRFADPLKIQHRPHDNAPDSGRRLRVGYVSPNFGLHPVGRFLLKLYEAHDHEQVEVTSYCTVRQPDAVNVRLREKSDRWIHTTGMSDETLAERIRLDGIDILVDLTMHMREHRLLTFARRPAPVQVTYLAYCSTTGLDAIDYRLTDPYLDPPGITDGFYSEKSIRLPRTYWCYEPGIKTPDVNELPALSTGRVTFASQNNFCKISPQTLDLWIRLIKAVKGSRLLLHSHRGGHRKRLIDRFAAEGIPGRLEFIDPQPLEKYFENYCSIDIALDPFPYPGGTTTCDALWMGVPTISLIGSGGYSRSGLTILSNAGLPELATDSQEKYVQAAIALAGDLPRLAQLRRTLRDRLINSPLMDGPSFARDVEACYRRLWQTWCASDRQCQPRPK